MDYKNIGVERRDKVVVLTLMRPDVLNALSGELLEEIYDFVKLKLGDARVLIITGAGERAFCAGADIRELESLKTFESAYRYLRRGQNVFLALEELPIPKVAVINGYALGGGLELALACSFRVASEKARLGQPEVNLGIIPGYGGTQRLVRVIGFQRAKILVMTGRVIDAKTAYEWGLVDIVVPQEKLMDESLKLAEELAGKPPLALSFGELACLSATSTSLEEGLRQEARLCATLSQTPEVGELMRKFREKRK